MEISAKMVKELRDKTNAGMMDCKQALAACECDLEKAVDWLRQKGLMTARKREGRSAREGLVAALISPDEKRGAMVELNCETDFVAKTDAFQELAAKMAEQALEAPESASLDDLLNQPSRQDPEMTVGDLIKNIVGTTGENMRLRRFVRYQAGGNAIVHTYIHAGGRLGVLVELVCEKTGPEAAELAHNLAMHIAAANPLAITQEAIPQELVEREKALYEAKAKESGKAAHLWPKIIEGNLRKFYGEVALMNQVYVKDDKKSVADVFKEAGRALGRVELKRYARFQLGEDLPGEEASEE